VRRAVRRAVRVHVDRPGAVEAFLYAVKEPERREIAPSAEYLAGIMRGARQRRLPEEYVRSAGARCRSGWR
jgi:hypothetical protein